MSPMEIMKDAEIERLKSLITELADALERKHLEDSEADCPHCQVLSALIQRAREETNATRR